MGVDGRRCASCGGQVPVTMPACPVCEPGVVLSTGQGEPLAAGASRLPVGGRRPVPLAPALAVLRDTPTLLVPTLLTLAAVAGVGTYWMGRVDAGPLWALEMFLLLLIMVVMLVAGFAVLTVARAVTVAGAVNLFAGVDRPVATAAVQVARRAVSVVSWTFMHGMTGLALAVSTMIFSRSTLQMQVGYDGVRNSQYVWQVMFGEDAGLARAMDRSAALVRAQLVGSRRFTLVVGLLVGGRGSCLDRTVARGRDPRGRRRAVAADRAGGRRQRVRVGHAGRHHRHRRVATRVGGSRRAAVHRWAAGRRPRSTPRRLVITSRCGRGGCAGPRQWTTSSPRISSCPGTSHR